MTKIEIPSTLTAARGDLKCLAADVTNLEQLLTAKKWSRAAIVYAFTKKDGGMLPDKFAALGIHGLAFTSTVLMYRDRWAAEVAAGTAPDVCPGDVVEIPDSWEWTDSARPGWGVPDRRPFDRVRSDSRKLTPEQKQQAIQELTAQLSADELAETQRKLAAEHEARRIERDAQAARDEQLAAEMYVEEVVDSVETLLLDVERGANTITRDQVSRLRFAVSGLARLAK